MSWKQLLAERRVAQEPTDRVEVESLRAVVHRNLSDAQLRGLSGDGRFAHAYDAARTLAVMVIRASGYRVKAEGGGHYNTFLALKAADSAFSAMSAYLETCRRKRNDLLYEEANVVSTSQAEDLLMRATAFAIEVESWLKKNHPILA